MTDTLANLSQKLTTAGAAPILGVHAATVAKLIEHGLLPAVDIGTGSRPCYRIDRSALDEFIARRSVRGAT